MIIEETQLSLKDGRKAVLKNPMPEDAEAVLFHMKQTAGETDFLVRYPEEIHLTVEEEKEFLEDFREDAGRLFLTAWLDGEMVAVTSLTPVGGQYKYRHRGSFGISIQKKAWGLGLGSAMAREILKYAKELGFTQVELGVDEENLTARHVYEKLGFVETGRIPRAFRLKDGSYHNEIQMVISAESLT
ncbi:MAG TPA: GNAT family N-acetyltransferase [Candidatus Limivivens merdigallinarum]|uniref:GNAT family N-acetyltransferase n=1 Tax=Candidatus Limivivens merdigallinarum TaxID=2840859 RepID=A0A9D0ZSL3_9FIRM|nr:GNAT family N-acetyltransferase [Candidatus Limivivens merdigallinarum]